MGERSVTVRLLAVTSDYDRNMKNSGRVTTDLGTQAQLSGAKVEGLGRSTNQAGNEATLAEKKFRALTIAATALAPAIVPLGSAAIAGGAALAGMGAAGILAVKGIKAEMAAGTPLGAAYAAQVQKLQGNLAALEQTAASGVLGDFQQAVTALQGDMPNVNGEIKTFSAQLGSMAGAGFQGLLNGAYQLEPALQQVGGYLDDLALKFETWTQDGGLSKFADYAQSVLPKVEALLNELGTTVSHLAQGFAPLGGTALTELSLVARAISDIPVSMLKDLIPIVTDAYLAFKAWQGISSAAQSLTDFADKFANLAEKVSTTLGLNTATTASTNALAAAQERAAAAATAQAVANGAAATALRGVAVAEGEAAAGAGALGAGEAAASGGMLARLPLVGGALGSVGRALTALGPEGLAAGAALAATGYLVHQFFVANAADAKAASKEVNAFYQALAMKTSNGNAPTTDQLQSELKASQDHLDSLKEQARQATSVLDQMQYQRENMAYPGAATDADGSAAVQADAAITRQSSAVHQLNLEVTDSAKKQAALAQALKQQADAAGADLTQMQQLESHFGLTASAGAGLTKILSAAGVALDGNALSASAENQAAINAVDAYQLQGSAASDLAADIGKMSDPLASVADKVDALTQSFNDLSSLEGGDVVRSQQNVQKSLNSLAQTLHDGKGAFDQFSDAGISSREAVDSSAQAAEAMVSSIIKSGGSVSDATSKYQAWYDNLVKTAAQQGVGKQKLDDYLSSLGELPSQIDPDIAKLKDLAGAIDGIHDKSVTVTTSYVSGGVGGHRLAGGGLVTGPGTGTSDSVPIRASNGEFVVNAAATAANLPLLHAINAAGYAAGGVIGGVGFAPGTYTTSSSSGSSSTSTKTAGGSSAKTPAQTAHDNAVAADDLWAAKALAAISPTNKLALAQEAVTEAQRRLANETTQGTTEYYQDLTKLHQAQSDLTAEVLAEAQARAQAQKQLAADERSYADLLGKEADTTAKYYSDLNSLAASHAAKDQQLLAQRQSDIEGFASANQKAVIQWGSSLSFLTGNVEDQADQITKWSKLLAEARAKGVSEAVISALGLDQGPQALGQLEQFSNATQDQIDALNKAVADKNAAAGQEVTTEAANNYGALGQALLAEQQSYADSVKALQTQFIADMAELAKEAQQAQTAINGDKATMVNGVYTDTATGRAAFYGPNGEPGSATKTAYYSAAYTMPDGRVAYYHPGDVAASQSYNSVPAGKPVAFSNNSIQAQVAPTFTTPQVRVFIGDTELKGIVRVEMSQANAEKKQAILVGGVR